MQTCSICHAKLCGTCGACSDGHGAVRVSPWAAGFVSFLAVVLTSLVWRYFTG